MRAVKQGGNTIKNKTMIASAVAILLLIFGISFSVIWFVNKSDHAVSTKETHETNATSISAENNSTQSEEDVTVENQEKEFKSYLIQ